MLAVDVAYHDERAFVGGVLFDNWRDDIPVREITTHMSPVKAYVPGRFYQRELPCILKLLQDLPEPVETIIVDGYAYLETKERPGLGMHLYRALFGKIAVIGVAKTAFGDTRAQTKVYRGSSQRPLYVTAAGIDEEFAGQCIAAMAGLHRIPILLKRLDQLCRRMKDRKNR